MKINNIAKWIANNLTVKIIGIYCTNDNFCLEFDPYFIQYLIAIIK